MLDFSSTVEAFLFLLQEHGGSTPTFRINYQDKQIEIVDACGSFVKKISAAPRALISLHKGVLTFQLFA